MAWDVAEPEVLVRTEDVSFSFGFVPVLKGISLDIKRGDFLSIIGPNGSGKTTLLRILLGRLKPSAGRVEWMGRPLEEFKEWRLVGYVPQKATHFDPLFPASAREVVAMALRSVPERRPRREEERLIQEALDIVGMSEFADRPVGRLSGGQQQRIFIARAIAGRPRILFLDEPTTGVDAGTQDLFYDLLGRLNAGQGLTIVLVTHDIGIANKHVTKVACLNQTLIYHGTHEDFCGSEALRDMLAGGHHLVSHRH